MIWPARLLHEHPLSSCQRLTCLNGVLQRKWLNEILWGLKKSDTLTPCPECVNNEQCEDVFLKSKGTAEIQTGWDNMCP